MPVNIGELTTEVTPAPEPTGHAEGAPATSEIERVERLLEASERARRDRLRLRAEGYDD